MSNESAPFVKNLIFQSKDLGKQSDLMLVFDGKVDGMGDHFPVVWRVSTFGDEGPYQMKATYRSQLAFTKPQVEHGSVIGAATAVEINAGQQTILTKTGNVFKFSAPVKGTSSYLKATNLAGAKQNLAIGFMGHGALLPTPMLYFKNVGDDDFVTAHFKPMLRAYVTSDYQETEIWKNSPTNSTFLWEEDLTDLDETTTWNLTWDGHTGRYTIAQA
ncbi:hypothetical protein DFJ58DRAFT_804235 [Suillus subalutaceus]|uniref:uncharacterized protein n=1 Tax=Suillus subalutaceus TaxID=48586 RepID=UPI001B8719E1|nr:uncharacterized protein DFJ58DRAFT_804235 [Suillus subalutaceus]KAG1843588.1 hypothetical protein DFJ58DRAFT_804235 [Suillus subalutaceus]